MSTSEYPEFLPEGLSDSLIDSWVSLLNSDKVSDEVKSLIDNTMQSMARKNIILLRSLQYAESALGDIGDAEREPEDDLEWCEKRAAEALLEVRKVLNYFGAKHSGIGYFLPPDKSI